MNSIEKEKQFYDNFWRHLRLIFFRKDLHFAGQEPNQEIIKFGRFVKKENNLGRVLDLGCGNGSNAIALAKIGFQTFGIDFSEEALRIARYNIKINKARVNLRLGNILDLPYKSNQFDAVVDSGCLHHLRKYQWPSYRENILKVLKPGGYYFLTCFSSKTDFNIKGFQGMNSKRNWNKRKGHVNHVFKKEEIDKLFGNNFVVIKEREFDRQGFPFWFWVFYMRKK